MPVKRHLPPIFIYTSSSRYPVWGYAYGGSYAGDHSSSPIRLHTSRLHIRLYKVTIIMAQGRMSSSFCGILKAVDFLG